MRKWIMTTGIIVAIIGTLFTGCSSSRNDGSSYRNTSWDIMHERTYTVYGRVLDQLQRPIDNCKIVLVKRNADTSPGAANYEVKGRPPYAKIEEKSTNLVAMTNRGGNYTFLFEPHGANDAWVYFDAEEQGFQPRMYELNELLGSSSWNTWGENPVFLTIVMEQKPN